MKHSFDCNYFYNHKNEIKNKMTPNYFKIAFSFLLSALFSITVQAQELSKEAALELIKMKANEVAITNAYTDPQTGLTFIYAQQKYKDIKAFNKIKSITLKGSIKQFESGKFIAKLPALAPSEVFTVTALQSVNIVLQDLKIPSKKDVVKVKDDFAANKKLEFDASDVCRRNVYAELFWREDEQGKVNLIWAIRLSPKNSSDNWNIKVDAHSGKILERINETISEAKKKHENPSAKNATEEEKTEEVKEAFIASNSFKKAPPSVVSAIYKVIPFPKSNPLNNSTTTVTSPWLLAGATNNATTHGWHFDGTNNYNYTRGNNVYAYDDSADQDIPFRNTISLSASPNLNFNYTPNFLQEPSVDVNRNFAVTNLFYWNNLMHDVCYQYGFNELSGNFQNDNIGRGGMGGDAVLAEAQDGSGLNNANFATDPDGGAGRMQMYLWNGTKSFSVLSPAGIAGTYTSKEGAFSINNLLKNVGPVTGQLAWYNDNTTMPLTHNACNAAVNNLTGKIALIQYAQQTGCTFRQRVKNAQNAGAIAVVIIHSGNTLPTMGGSDNSVTIPAVIITNSAGATISPLVTNGDPVIVKLEASVKLDGDLESGIVCHEYGHGISNRLTGGPSNTSCLDNAEQGGEGWSDYLALMMTTNWATALITDGTNPRSMGTYVIGQPDNGAGIRTYPYTTNMSVNPHTYDILKTYGESHFIGEVWCSAIWDMTWDIITQENFIEPNLYNAGTNGGNVIAMNLVMLGMKLQTCSPGFLDSRDAILAADDILYNGRHKCTIWKSFARRGMGYSAVQGSSNSTNDQIAAYDIPNSVRFSGKPDVYKVVPSTTNTNFNIKTNCQCKVPTNGYKVKAILPAGFSYVSSIGGVSNADSVVFANRGYNKEFQLDSVALVIKATATGCAIDSIIHDDRDSYNIGNFSSNSIKGTNQFTSSSTYSHSPTQSWQALDIAIPSVTELRSTSFLVKPISLLSFWHRYDFEGSYDGGLVEVSKNNGTTWDSLDKVALQNGFNATLDATAGLPNRKAYSGTNPDFQQSIFNLSKYNGNNLVMRFKVGTDSLNGFGGVMDGWNVDDIVVANGCGGLVRFFVYDSTNTIIDSASVPVYITPQPLPVKIVSFTAKAISKKALLHWQVAEQINIKKYVVEKSTDNKNWQGIGDVNVSKSDYDFTDENLFSGINYYRIKANDFDGSYTYSNVQSLVFNGNKNLFTLIPNPAKDEVKIAFDKYINNATIKITDLLGKVVFTQNISKAVSVSVNTTSFLQGTYFVNVSENGINIFTDKLVIRK